MAGRGLQPARAAIAAKSSQATDLHSEELSSTLPNHGQATVSYPDGANRAVNPAHSWSKGDSDLAELYGVTTARLNQQVRRNSDRFPEDFAFDLTREEFEDLMLQFATSSSGWGGRRKLPVVFTEHGAVMAASVLNSPIAVAASIEVVRVFVRLRQLLASHVELARKLTELEAKFVDHDRKLVVVFDAIPAA